MAIDPIGARYYTDYAGYRYARVLYPLLARIAALGNTTMIPYTLLLINLFSIAVGTFFISRWLEKNKYSPWFALVYGLFPGLTIALQRDTAEPLAYAFITIAMYILYFGGKYKIVLSALFFLLHI